MKKNIMKKLFASAAIIMLAGTASAQLVGGSVFLKGKYVEAGICANGDFGAATPPAGYHPHSGVPGGPLGFVADPDMDGWTVGTPAYKGDFFVPGFPYEAFNVQIGSAIRTQSQSCMGFTGAGTLTGTNTAYAASGSKVIGTWIGMLDSVTIKQETTLDTLDLYFTMRITLINTASVPKNDIYYLRTVDPDNDESWPPFGSFTTKNKIEYQLPNAANASVVSARGTADTTSYLSLGTADSNAVCFVYPSLTVRDTVDISTIFGGTYPFALFAAGSTNFADEGMGLAFHINHLAPVDSASDSVAYKTTNAAAHHKHPANQKSFTFFYAFSRPAVDSAIKALVDTATHTTTSDTTVIPVTGIKNINNSPAITAYPNPAQNLINVENAEVSDRLTIYDLMGKPVIQQAASGNRVTALSLQNIPSGNYVLTVSDTNGNVKARIPVRKQ